MASGKFSKNFIYIQQQIIALLKNTSNTVKCIWLIVFISYSFSFFDEAVEVISVTPGYIIPPNFRVWTAFTFCFLETHFWSVCIDVVMIGICGKVIEPLWGPTEIISFFAIVNLGVALLTSVFYLFIFACTAKSYYLFDVHIHGLYGYIAGVTVAIKQIMPDILIIKTPVGRITNRNMPLLTIFLLCIFWLIGVSQSVNVIMVTTGVYVSWIYLRFYQKHSSGNYGDMSDSFNFASFFPNIMQPWVAIFANTVYDLLVRMKICKKRNVQFESSSELTAVTVSQDKERRKQKALKALSEHLNKTDRQRGASATLPQIPKPQSPKKGAEFSVPSSPTTFVSETKPLLSNEQTDTDAADSY